MDLDPLDHEADVVGDAVAVEIWKIKKKIASPVTGKNQNTFKLGYNEQFGIGQICSLMTDLICVVNNHLGLKILFVTFVITEFIITEFHCTIIQNTIGIQNTTGT